MRKFIVKYFALYYKIKLLKLDLIVLRSSTIIFPSFILTAFLQMNNIYLGWLFLIPSLYFGFIYFHFYPVKWGELDKYQKIVYGTICMNKLTINQLKEWKQLKKINTIC